eukprot:19876-Heterococcus_DN1.PRE.2
MLRKDKNTAATVVQCLKKTYNCTMQRSCSHYCDICVIDDSGCELLHYCYYYCSAAAACSVSVHSLDRFEVGAELITA